MLRLTYLVACVVMQLAFSVSAADGVAANAGLTYVVTRCESPSIATHAFSQHRCAFDGADWISGTKTDLCGGSYSKQLKQYSLCDAAARPEFDTVRIGRGRGMEAVAPWSCGAIRTVSGLQPVPAIPPAIAEAVVEVRPGPPPRETKRVIASGVLIAKDLILTAAHVAELQNTSAHVPGYVVFGHNNADLGDPMPPGSYAAAPITTRKAKPNFECDKPYASDLQERLDVVACSPSEKLDYAIIRIDTSRMSRSVAPMKLSTASEASTPLRGKPTVLGYTDNPFYPRGLVASRGEHWIDFANMHTDIAYDANTAHGFSGGAILDDQFNIVGIHTQSHSADNVDKDCNFVPGTNQVLRDFSKPNGGRSMRAILKDLSRQTDDELKSFLPDDLFDVVVTYRPAALPATTGTTPIQKVRLHHLRKVNIEITPADYYDGVDENGTGGYKPKNSDSGCFFQKGCRYELYDPKSPAESKLPVIFRNKRLAVAKLVRKKDGRDDVALLGTVVLLTPTLALTAGHVLAVAEVLSDPKVHLQVETTPDGSKGCDAPIKIERVLSASAPSRFDYGLLRLPADTWLANKECELLYLEPQRPIPESSGLGSEVYAIGHYTVENDNHLSLFYTGTFLGAHRWPKDGGGTLNYDYWLKTEEGLSGGAVLDSNFRWIALHQRSLERAALDQQTDWHPYNQWHYLRTTPLTVSYAPLRDCLLQNGGNRWRCLPGQGTSLLDISVDIEQKLGAEWLCKNARSLAGLSGAERKCGQYGVEGGGVGLEQSSRAQGSGASTEFLAR